MEAREWGKDLQVLIGGGTVPHIGAVAVSYWDEGILRTESIQLPHHKEGELAKKISERLTSFLKRTVSVSIGIHIDHATQEEILLLVNHAEELVNRYMELISPDEARDSSLM